MLLAAAVAGAVLLAVLATVAPYVAVPLAVAPLLVFGVLRVAPRLDPTVRLVCLFLLTQPLTAFAVQTPVVSVTVDNAILVVVAATRLLGWRAADRTGRWITTLLVLWVFSYPLRISYLPVAETGRHLVTAVSFLLIFLVARTLQPDWLNLRAMGWSAYAAIAVFGVTAMLAGRGILPLPNVAGEVGRRAIFGVVSPYPRNYGLNVAIDSIAMLSAVAVPLLVYLVLSRRTAAWERGAAVLAVGALVYWALFYFQARGILLQVPLSTVVLAFLLFPRLRAPVVAGAGLVAAHTVTGLLTVDVTSSDLRVTNYTYVWQLLTHDPLSFALGRDENLVFREAAASAGWLEAITSIDDAMHNAFLSALVGGGAVAFVGLTGAYLLGLAQAVRSWRVLPGPVNAVLLTALVVVIFEMMIEPSRAQVVGNWLVLGLVAAGTDHFSSPRRTPAQPVPPAVASIGT
ncbi:hypothetical protein FE374_04010 [Georgenia yuyongxinii]|uniref:O-antigen ligase domain-containing protein n=1 Tax=Georgenia yuyongxinii TaxID=2589797 RepID=A0A5B8C0E3_9MICO|nr:hypothetical protein [Georgenia yuyongxinii]QDC23908.1 hypothetical protein FE374_04010 [Georgenia yuyongxinii]